LKNTTSNIKKLYLFNILIGLQFGIAALSTTFQLLFSKVGGEGLLTKLNQVEKYSIIMCLLLIGIDIAHIGVKKYIALFEGLKNATFLILIIFLFINKLNPIVLTIAFVVNVVTVRLLHVYWMDFNMRTSKKEDFKSVISNIMFYRNFATLAGMGIAYFVIKLVYPYNFITIFAITAALGAVLIGAVLSVSETGFKKEGKRHIKYNEIFKLQMEKNCLFMCVGKIILNLSYGVPVLFAMLAIRKGYTDQQIVLLGIITFIAAALFAKIIPKTNLTSKQNMLIGHFLVGLSGYVAFITSNFYIAALVYGLSSAFINIGYYGFQNGFDAERKHVYMTTQTSINFTTGFGVFICAKLINVYGFYAAVTFSVVAAIMSISFILFLDDTEKQEERELAIEH